MKTRSSALVRLPVAGCLAQKLLRVKFPLQRWIQNQKPFRRHNQMKRTLLWLLPVALALESAARAQPVKADVVVTDANTRPVEDSVGYTGSVLKKKPELYAATTTNRDEDGDGSETPASDNNAFFMAVSMIVVSEIGDKTFLISALMAMRHSRMLVFSASFASLALMTVLSGLVGHALPSLLSKRVTQFLAAALFVVFGYKLTREGLAMSKDLGVDEELAEVEEELTVNDMNYGMDAAETGGQQTHRSRSLKEKVQLHTCTVLRGLKDVSALVFSPLWVQVFVMIFLGEWGDRSQIATIAMAAGSDYWLVIMGAVVGHGVCTAGAVVGGKILASHISMRTVTLGGAFAFFLFSILYLYDALYSE